MTDAPDEAPTCDAEGCTRPGILHQSVHDFVNNRSWVRHWCLMHDPEDDGEHDDT